MFQRLAVLPPQTYIPKNTEYTQILLLQDGNNKSEPIADLNGTAWHTSVWAGFPVTWGSIHVQYSYKLNVAALRSKWNPTALSILSTTLKCTQTYGGTPRSITTLTAKVDGSIVPNVNGLALLPGSGYPGGWSLNNIPLAGLDLTNAGTLEILIDIELASGAPPIPGWIDWYFGDLEIAVNVETPYQVTDTYVACSIPAGSPDNIMVQISDVSKMTDITGVAGPFSLPAGNYVAYATKTVGTDVYTGSVSFTVPYTQIPVIQLTAPWAFELPWWWWIPVAALGAGVFYYVFIRAPAPERQPIYVVK